MGLNVVDYAIIGIIALSLIAGMYKGFVSSLAGLVGFFAAWLASYLLSPGIVGMVTGNPSIMSQLTFYSDASTKMSAVPGLARSAVDNLAQSTMDKAASVINLPEPFASLFQQNVASQAYEKLGLSTLGDYLNQTVVTAAVNIVCFLVVFAVCYLAIIGIINLLNSVFRFPLLRHCDTLLGGVFGLVRGYFLVFLLLSLVPMIMTFVPIAAVSDLIAASRLGGYFINANFITHMLVNMG